MAGLFGLYALFGRPDTFTRYIVGSPSMHEADPAALTCERDFAANHCDLPATVFMGAGSLEDEAVIVNVRSLDGALRGRGYDGLRLKTHVFEGENHVSVVPFSLSRGLRVVFGSDNL